MPFPPSYNHSKVSVLPEECHGEIGNFGVSTMLKKWESPHIEEDLPSFSSKGLLEMFKPLDFEVLFSVELTSNQFDPCRLSKIQLEVNQAHPGPPAGQLGDQPSASTST